MNSPAAPMVAEHNANLLLAALPPEDLARMLPALDQIIQAAAATSRTDSSRLESVSIFP